MPALLDPYGRPLRREPARIRAKYDAAQTVTYNSGHWANADQLSPDAAASAAVRRKLRSRSRYEAIENNGYLKGMVLTLANDTVGRGPKLQITDARITRPRRRFLERRWAAWSKAVQLRDKLWRLRVAKIVDGEGFAVLANNPRNRHPLALDLRIVEADQVATPMIGFENTVGNEIDGVRFDSFGNASEYHLLRNHPGNNIAVAAFTTEGDWVPADLVVHWYRRERGWLRGIPETAPSLPLCALLRRYTLAVVLAAETAASFAGALETESGANPLAYTDGEGTTDYDIPPMDTFQIEKGMFTALPYGYKLTQLKPEQPSGMYDGFVQALLLEIARPLMIPHNRAISTSKDSNMASAVVDEHAYKAGIEFERSSGESAVLEPLLGAWWTEGRLTGGYFDEPLLADDGRLMNDFRPTMLENPSLAEPPEHVWRWDMVGVEHTDPLKVEKAWAEAHANGFVTDRDIQERRYNRDLDEWADEMAEGLAMRAALGLGGPGAEDAALVPDDGDEDEGDEI